MPRTVAGLLLCGALLAGTPAAHASLPGRDGRIAVTIEDDGSCGDMGGHLCEYDNVYTVRHTGGALKPLAQCPDLTGGCVLDRASWSPDGGLLAYSSGGGSEVVNIRTRHTRQLNSVDSDPAWSPNGKRLVFSVPGEGLYTIRPDGTGLDQITQGDDRWPTWSVLGEIAFSRRIAEGHSEIRVVSDDGGRTRRLVDGGSQPDWSPDGRRLVYARVKLPFGIFGSIHSVSRRGRHRRELATGLYPAWAPRGKWILHATSGGIHAVRPNGTHRRRIDTEPDGPIRGLAWQPLP